MKKMKFRFLTKGFICFGRFSKTNKRVCQFKKKKDKTIGSDTIDNKLVQIKKKFFN